MKVERRLLQYRYPALGLLLFAFLAGANIEAQSSLDNSVPDAVVNQASIPAPSAQPVPARKSGEKHDVSKIGTRKVGSGVNFYSLEREKELGRELAAQIEQSSRVVDDTVVIEYINRLGQQLVAHSDAKVDFTIKVLDSDEINAFALPGGYLYVNTGLIVAAENEAELAGVMAHEIAHVAARHATRNATRTQIINIASTALGMFGGAAFMVAREIAGVAVPMSILKFSRNAEREADLLGIQYQYAAGYDPNALVQFFERLQSQQKKKGFIARSFETHPMKQERVKLAQEEMALLPDRDMYIVSTSTFEEVRDRVVLITGASRLVKRDSKPELVLRRHDTPEGSPKPPSQ